jgi:hypothetical protein
MPRALCIQLIERIVDGRLVQTLAARVLEERQVTRSARWD